MKIISQGKHSEDTLLKVILFLATVIVFGFLITLGMMTFDLWGYNLHQIVNQPPTITIIEPSTTAIPLAQGGLPITPTAFQPLPTDTPTPTATLTATASPTPVSSPTPISTDTPQPTPTPWPPQTARIQNIYGYAQSLNLTCESRSAVDWARYFGVNIGELEFFNNLPRSDNPDKGFVGSGNDPPGRIPPDSYGVNAYPVAALLRAYGLPAEDHRNLAIDQLKHEVASGRPVIVWIVGATVPGYALTYIAQDGEEVLVAPNEHTAIVIGYDNGGVTILDGAVIYWRNWDTFIRSFAVLENMAITFQP
jgi:uncharacterized protein YvpB